MWWLVMSILSMGVAYAGVVEQAIEYQDGDTTLQGFLYYDDVATDKRPGVLVVHEWWGLSDYPKSRARLLAELGYVAFACDMYGKGVYGKTHEEAARLAGPYFQDRQAMRKRVRAGYDAMCASPWVDVSRTAAMGYCFGGTAALELARSGVPLKAVASFHGMLSTPYARDARNIHGEVMVCTGADDPNVPGEQVGTFMKEMRDAKVLFGLYAYPGAVHAFTVPSAGGDLSTGMAYNHDADIKSWAELKELLYRTIGLDETK